MGYQGNLVRIPLNLSGIQAGRNPDLFDVAALLEASKNVNYHENGIGKRGGTANVLSSAISGNPAIRGLYQYRKRSGTSFTMFSDATGKLYWNSASNVLKTGMSTTNYFSFALADDNVFIADGTTTPQYWDGSAATTTSVTAATSWTGNMPFQLISHSRGANDRMWAVTKDSLWASKDGTPTNFSDAEVVQISIDAPGGLVGAFDFGGTLFAFSKTKTYIIDDNDVDVANWGAYEAQWDGGVAHWRLIVKAGNNLYLMSEEGNMYSLRGVQATGDYEQSTITRPANIDRYIREKVILSDIETFHASYDRKLRAIKWFIREGGSTTNTALVYFIDRPDNTAWSRHNNESNASGYTASISAEFLVSTGNFQVYTGDFSGMIWSLEQISRSDNGNSYSTSIKIRRQEFGNRLMWKHFHSTQIKTGGTGNYTLTARTWIDGVRQEDQTLTISGSGATFDTAIFDTDVFAEDSLVPIGFEIKAYGYDIQHEFINDAVGEDFFHTELLFLYKECGVKI